MVKTVIIDTISLGKQVADLEKQVKRVSRINRTLTALCVVLTLCTIKNHLDICEQDRVIEKLRREKSEPDA